MDKGENVPSIEVQQQETDTPEPEVVANEAVVEQPVPIARKRGLSRVVIAFIVIIVVALIAGLILVLRDRNHLKGGVSKLSQSQVNSADEAKQLHEEVSKLMELPTDEVPTVATVVDADKVKNQAFFAHAQNGDKVLLYAKSSKAILYRPSTQKIIEVAPINLNTTQTTGVEKK